MMLMASNGHFFTQIPHPIQRGSEMKAILDEGATSIHSRPIKNSNVRINLAPPNHVSTYPFGQQDSSSYTLVGIFLVYTFPKRLDDNVSKMNSQ